MAALALLLLAASTAAAAPVRTLGDAYAQARANMESVAASEATLRQAEALYWRSVGVSLPEISLRSQTDIRDPINQAFTDVFLRIGQTNLNGYREFAAIKQTRADEGRRAAELLRAEQLLLGDVAGAFYGLLQSQEDVKATQELEQLAGRRLSELRERVRVGRTREADSIAQEVQAAGLRSQLEESGRQSAERADLIKFLTKAEAVEPTTSDAPLAAPEKPLEDYLARTATRPDVEALRRAAEAQLAAVRLARADRLPSVNYGFNYYLSRPANLSRNFRTSGDWDASLTAIMPLFSWGGRWSNVSAAQAGLSAQELAYAQGKRAAELEVRNAWRDHTVARRQLDILKNALGLAERDYQLQRRDESRGLVTALEVLESLNRLNNARLTLNRAVLAARLAAVRLELAAGAKPAEIDLR